MKYYIIYLQTKNLLSLDYLSSLVNEPQHVPHPTQTTHLSDWKPLTRRKYSNCVVWFYISILLFNTVNGKLSNESWILCHEYQNCEFCGWNLMKFTSFHEIYWNPMRSRCEIYWFLWNQPKFNTAWNLWNSYEIYWNIDYIIKSIWNPMKSRYEIYWFLWNQSKFNTSWNLWNSYEWGTLPYLDFAG